MHAQAKVFALPKTQVATCLPRDVKVVRRRKHAWVAVGGGKTNPDTITLGQGHATHLGIVIYVARQSTNGCAQPNFFHRV